MAMLFTNIHRNTKYTNSHSASAQFSNRGFFSKISLDQHPPKPFQPGQTPALNPPHTSLLPPPRPGLNCTAKLSFAKATEGSNPLHCRRWGSMLGTERGRKRAKQPIMLIYRGVQADGNEIANHTLWCPPLSCTSLAFLEDLFSMVKTSSLKSTTSGQQRGKK